MICLQISAVFILTNYYKHRLNVIHSRHYPRCPLQDFLFFFKISMIPCFSVTFLPPLFHVSLHPSLTCSDGPHLCAPAVCVGPASHIYLMIIILSRMPETSTAPSVLHRVILSTQHRASYIATVYVPTLSLCMCLVCTLALFTYIR